MHGRLHNIRPWRSNSDSSCHFAEDFLNKLCLLLAVMKQSLLEIEEATQSEYARHGKLHPEMSGYDSSVDEDPANSTIRTPSENKMVKVKLRIKKRGKA